MQEKNMITADVSGMSPEGRILWNGAIEVFSRVGLGEEEIYQAFSKMICESGSLDNMFVSTYAVLRDNLGERGALLAKLIFGIASRRISDSFRFGKVNSDEDIAMLFAATMFTYNHEVVFLLTLDEDGRAIALDHVCEGSVNAFNVTPRRIIEAALDRGSKRVIIGHNHPLNTSEPSGEDKRSTVQLAQMLSTAGIRFDGHVVTAGRSASMIKLDRNDCDRISVSYYNRGTEE